MRCFHLPGYFVIALLCGLTYKLSAEHEFVPVNITPFVNAHSAPRVFFCALLLWADVAFRGLPPFLPFSLDAAALRLEVDSPLHAGQ